MKRHILAIALPLLAAGQDRLALLSKAKVFEHQGSNPKDPANRHGFNHAPSIVRMPDGKLLTVWFSGPFEASSRQSLMGTSSGDQGRTWQTARLMQDFPDRSDFDPSFVAAGSTTYWFFSAGLRSVPRFEQIPPGTPDGPGTFRVYARSSADSGKTWSQPAVVYDEPAHTSRSNGIRLSTGELLVPVHRLGTKAGGVLKSADGGKTWGRRGEVANPAGQGGEPTIAELTSGHVLMLLRTTDGKLWSSRSIDKGETWSVARDTGMAAGATSHNLLRLRDGRLVLTHNPSTPPLRTPLTMRVSADDGDTWGEPLVLAEAQLRAAAADRGRQVAYPSAAELPDGTIAVVWTQLSMSDEEMTGDIWSARVRVSPPGLQQSHLFRAGEGAYFAYRIPSVIATKKGTLLAFLEGRKESLGDQGNIDMLLTRSTDGGESWQPYKVIADRGRDGIGNPVAVQDRRTGRIWLMMTGMPGDSTKETLIAGTAQHSVWMAHSDDDGVTWTAPADITASIRGKGGDKPFYAGGPGNAIQLAAGRLLFPNYYRLRDQNTSYAHAIYTDDGGKSWIHGQPAGELTNESQAVELSDGTVMLNMRSYRGRNRRAVSISPDGGKTWREPVLDDALVEPVCQASIIRHRQGPRQMLVFSNPASERRENMTVRLSHDDGRTWPVAKSLHAGASAYSSLVSLPGGGVGCFYESGTKSPYERLTFARMAAGWLTGSK
ncbi:MAG: exo-alpha-sialidase [Acidobacteria bacterium]|nr:exo-alpha-sialidase [Acidobacteriota bacterium]